MQVTCKQCGKIFELPQSEISFYEKKNLELPKRCKECREANKKGKAGAKPGSVTQGGSGSGSGHYGSNTPGNKKVYYIVLGILLVLLLIGKYVLPELTGSNSGNQSGYQEQQNIQVTQESTQQVQELQPYESEEPEVTPKPEPTSVESSETIETPALKFRNAKLLKEHYEKHGIEMGFASQEEYQAAAAAVVVNPAVLHKTEAEDGDDVYYVESTNEFVVVSKDGYIRTYFNPSSGKKYYDRQ